ncbi:MAG: hypothetical protein GX070_02885 [Alcaligenaceae bacterium]|nr:hypothetical protein [Alcaligenaceae bacterium]
MQVKTGRGIQQEDVWQAADALLQEGLRPTIERIRLKIGRGSPNTISPMLENWFSILGQRINGKGFAQENPVQVPEPVDTLIRDAWAQALEKAQEIANETVVRQVEDNRNFRQALEAERQEFEQNRALHQAAMQEQEKLLSNMTLQINELKILLAKSNQDKETKGREINQLKIQIAELLTEKNRQQQAAEQALLNLNQQHATERGELESRFKSSELRSVAEIDRARQETKQLQNKYEQQLKTDKSIQEKTLAELDSTKAEHRQLLLAHEARQAQLMAAEDKNRQLMTQLEQLRAQTLQETSELKKANESLSMALAKQQQSQDLQKDLSILLEKLQHLNLEHKEDNNKTLE